MTVQKPGNKKFLALIAFATLTLGLVLSACNANANTSATEGARTQWEYLVITPGKAYFEYTSAIDDPKIKELSDSGLFMVQASTGTSNTLDKFGKLGWELVGIVGQIGGDQQYVFKRPL